eukprot:Rhum_TRINITY_DN14420_c13_g1::Rhum_TRINITY_DN14420_c13_g1_i1::g.89524::m.89524
MADLQTDGIFVAQSRAIAPLVHGSDLVAPQYQGKNVRIVGQMTGVEGSCALAVSVDGKPFAVDIAPGRNEKLSQYMFFEGVVSPSTDPSVVARLRDEGLSTGCCAIQGESEESMNETIQLMRMYPEVFGEQQ